MESENNGNEEQNQTIIDGKYLKIKRLGSGTEGVAYKVKEIKTGKIYVAKIMEFEKLMMKMKLKKMRKFYKLKKIYLIKFQL